MVRMNVVLVIKDVEYRNAFIRAVSMQWSGFTFLIPDVGCNLKKFDAELVIYDDYNDTLLQSIMSEYASAGIKFVRFSNHADEEALFCEPYVLHKYDCATSIVSKLKYIIGRGPLISNKNHKCVTVSVISDEGGIGTSTFSLAISGMLNVLNRKSLYVSLSPVNICKNYGAIFDDRPDTKLIFPKFIYSCFINKPLPILSVIDSKNQINFLRCPLFNFNYSDFSLDTANHLVSLIGQEEYRFLIYDIGNHFTPNSVEIIKESDIVVYFYSIRNYNGEFKLPFDCNNVVKVITATCEELERYKYQGYYVPRCRTGNFYGFNNEYGIEISKIASHLGGLT